ncbi:flagellin N-terminal helical domain-containing protein [Kozakia baliensis]|uniref:flagellin N-terminal helical domain-containing protein n=1 Tax=Kozakia baliensis TaxID=153496 RepID=UPI0004977037|nr:flagellin [Kozakia baliensis]
MTMSINTNLASIAALKSLNDTSAALTSTENKVSTGKNVNSASDDPAVYAIAQTMNSQIGALAGVSSGLQFANQVVGTASTAAGNISNMLSSLSSAIAAAGTTGYDKSSMNNQITSTLSQITKAANGATFQGVNLLAGGTGNGVKFTSVSTAEDVNGSIYTQSGFNATAAGLGLQGLNVDQAGAKLSFSTSAKTQSNLGASLAAGDSISIENTAVSGGGSAQNPAISYNFVAHGTVTATAPETSTDAAVNALNKTLGSTTTDVTMTSDGKLSITDTASMPLSISSSKTDSNGDTTYTLSNNNTITQSKDQSGNATFTVSTAFDANGNATAQTKIVDVNIGSGSGVDKASNFMGAMTNAGFGVSQDSSTGDLTIVGNNIASSSTTYTSGATSNAPTAKATDVSGSDIAQATVQAAISKMNSISSSIGSAGNQISQLQTSTSSVSASLTSGVGALTDADLAAESAKLTSLQTKQQLAIQSLSIANSQSSTLLSLFRG